MAIPKLTLPARDRILLHLADFGRVRGEGSYPPGMTQDGIAKRTGLARAHVATTLKSLREDGLVEELRGRVPGEARRRKLYALSPSGLDYSRRLLSEIMELEVELRREGAEPVRTKLSGASFLLPRKPSLVELALAVDEEGVVSAAPDGSIIGLTGERAPEAAGTREEASLSGAGPEPRARPHPTPEELLSGLEAVPAEELPEGATPSAPLTQFGALLAGALALITAIMLGGWRAGIELRPDFVLIYFATLASIELVQLLSVDIPPQIRAELGLFTGVFMALYGGCLVLAPPLQSLLWVAQGALALLTGLLISPLGRERIFTTAGASAGAFMVLLGALGATRFGEAHMRLFSAIWIPVGLVFVALRLAPGRERLAARLRLPAALAAGQLPLALGLFLITRGLYAESIVELVVWVVIIYHLAPRRREEWDAALTATATMLSLVVVLTCLAVLSYLTA